MHRKGPPMTTLVPYKCGGQGLTEVDWTGHAGSGPFCSGPLGRTPCCGKSRVEMRILDYRVREPVSKSTKSFRYVSYLETFLKP